MRTLLKRERPFFYNKLDRHVPLACGEGNMQGRKLEDLIMNTVNKNATKEVRELLDYLYSVAGKQIITGQHTQTIPMEEAEHIYKVTGHKPMLRGFELLSYSQNINYDDMTPECLTEIVENRGTVDTAIQWYKETKGIVALCFHWYSPTGGRDKSFYQKNTDFDASKILIEGSDERKAFYHDMDALAEITGTIATVQEHQRPDLQIYGIIITMFDKRTSAHRLLLEEIQELADSLQIPVLTPPIRKAIAVEEVQLGGSIYDSRSRAAEDYQQIVDKILSSTNSGRTPKKSGKKTKK